MRKKIVTMGAIIAGAGVGLFVVTGVIWIVGWFVPFLGLVTCCTGPLGALAILAGIVVLIIGFVMSEDGAASGGAPPPPPPGRAPPPPPPK